MRDTSRPHAHAPTVPSAPSHPDVRRRRFLLGLGAGSAAAVAAAAPARATAIVSPEEPTAAVAADGYRETEHVRHYYATARI